ncbi:NAD(P)-binding protein [Aspergillus bertholletiae]|uniref:3-dehydrosphinganine reductase n=1 Tax=Aspergillus bertholletiae TaxID=1226010 RepID=A0A5N7BEY6_9EURO|nr:NAD(P)-binding protein [Aspergillus bertholletiae]
MFGNKFDVNGKLVVVAGGSRGLGKAIALELASKGANLLILARTESTLQAAQHDIEAACISSKQIIDTRSVDLTKPDEITKALRHYHPPDILVCAAGSTPSQVGFLVDIPPEALTSCMESNYYTTIFAVQCCLRLWLVAPQTPSPRHIILTSSTAAFLGLPGYVAYTATRVAIRALADTLRQELLLYGEDAFKVHCCFPGTFLSESFFQEQEHKPGLTKVIEGTSMSQEKLEHKIPGAREVARKIVRSLEKGKTYIPVDFQTELLLNNMRGPSPRFWTVCDFLLGLLASLVWWAFRVDFDRKTRRYGATRNGRDTSSRV